MKKPPTKKSKKPAGAAQQRQMVVLVDKAGNYYELSRATLERSRVPERRKAQLKKALKEVESGSGYIGGPHVPGPVVKPPKHHHHSLRFAGSYLKKPKSKS